MRAFYLPIIAALSFGGQSFAADVGTYRPGNIYLTIPALAHTQCAAQCGGDAQCKSWNFVQAGHNRNYCEFNTRESVPVSSAISISGGNPSAYNSARIIQAGYNTTRIGQIETSQLVPIQGSLTRIGSVPQPPQIQRQVRRPQIRVPAIGASAMATPTQAVDRTSQHSYTGPTNQFRHSLDSRQTIRTRAETRTNQSPFAAPQSGPVRQAVTTQKFTPMLDTQGANMTVANMASKPPQRALPTPSLPSISEIPQNVLTPSVESALAGGPRASASTSNSLYGSLFDDVKAPRSLTTKDIPEDLNAPIPTVTSVPIERLDVQPF